MSPTPLLSQNGKAKKDEHVSRNSENMEYIWPKEGDRNIKRCGQ